MFNVSHIAQHYSKSRNFLTGMIIVIVLGGKNYEHKKKPTFPRSLSGRPGTSTNYEYLVETGFHPHGYVVQVKLMEMNFLGLVL